MLSSTHTPKCLFVFATAVVCLIGASALADTSLNGSGSVAPEPGTATREAPTLVMSFYDPIQQHCMGITSDGSYYYTINGGNASWGEIRTYDLAGNPVNVVACAIDARSIHYNATDGYLYAKGYDRNWYRVDATTGTFQVIFSGLFQFSQSSAALTPDGAYVMEHEGGTLHVYDATTGALVNTMTGFYCGGFPSETALATDGCRLFTWDGSLTYVYDMEGTFIESWTVPQGNYGFSPSWANGLFWTADDGTDMWYGYDVGASPSPTEETTWGAIKGLYR